MGEVFPRVMSALTGTLIGDAVARGQTEVLVEMGVLRPHEVTGPSVGTGVFGGYLYMNGSAMRLFGVRMPGMTPADADEQVMGEVTDLPPYRPAKGDRNLVASLALSRYVARLLRSPDLPVARRSARRRAGVAGVDARPGFGGRRAVAVVVADLSASSGGEHEAAAAVQRRGRSAPGPARPPPGPPRDPARPGQPDRQRDRRRRLRPAGPATVGARSHGGDRCGAVEHLRRRARRDRRPHRAHGAETRPSTPSSPTTDTAATTSTSWPRRPGRWTRHRSTRPSTGCGTRRRIAIPFVVGERLAVDADAALAEALDAPAAPPAMVHPTLRADRPTGLDRPRASQGRPRAREPGRPPRPPRTGPSGGGAWRAPRRTPRVLRHHQRAGRLRGRPERVRRADRRREPSSTATSPPACHHPGSSGTSPIPTRGRGATRPDRRRPRPGPPCPASPSAAAPRRVRRV